MTGTEQSCLQISTKTIANPSSSNVLSTPVLMLATLTARMLTGAVMLTVRMKGVWLVRQALTALLSFITQRINSLCFPL